MFVNIRNKETGRTCTVAKIELNYRQCEVMACLNRRTFEVLFIGKSIIRFCGDL